MQSGVGWLRKERKVANFIKSAIKHPGALHRDLGVPEGQKIPPARIEAATHSNNPKIAARARLAQTLARMHK